MVLIMSLLRLFARSIGLVAVIVVVGQLSANAQSSKTLDCDDPMAIKTPDDFYYCAHKSNANRGASTAAESSLGNRAKSETPKQQPAGKNNCFMFNGKRQCE
jgi:hypothetical protein